MELRRNRAASSVRTEGGLLPSDLLGKIAGLEPDVPGLTDADFGLASGERLREAITRSWNRLVGAWAALEAVRVTAEPTDPLTGSTRERFLLPLMDELGFARLPVARAVEIEGTTYPISHGWADGVPVHLVGFGVELDTRTKGVRGAAGAAPHALVQEYLNRADTALWGLVSNGRTLRLLRDSTSLTRQAYVEFDLEAIFTGELYADFALLWSVCHRTRFDGERPADCLLERWTKKAADDGTRALDKLRGGVEKAIETLGAGFLAHPGNGDLRKALRSGALDRQDYYRELLRLVYRLIFLFTAEDRRDETTGRELLLDPAAPDDAVERYRRFYSTVRLRSFAGRHRGTRHPDLWVSLRRVIAALGSGGAPTLALPALGSFLFGIEACVHLDGADLRNEDLLDAVRALATIEEDRRLRLVDYRNLGAEELGGIYEGLLELHPRVELDANPPRFALGTVAGNERKATGSYYTPTSLISCLLDSALDPVLDEAVRGKAGPEAEAAILGLAVVDPAAGSGHFLIAAAHRLAKRLAAVRSGEGEPPPAQVRHALRDVIARCIYAVDINPMAVELCKVSLWLEALEPGKPLSFLDAHVKCGNSLLGTTPELTAAGVPDAAFEAISGDDKAVARDFRRINAGERAGQYSLFGAGLEDPVGPLAAEARALEALPEDSPAGVAEKAARHQAHLASAAHVRAKAALDAWCAAFVVPKAHGAPGVTTATARSLAVGGSGSHAATRELVERTAADFRFFHWPLEFPAVFERGGFDAVLGNPPWDQIQLDPQEWFAERAPDVATSATSAKRAAMIARIEHADQALWSAYQAALRQNEAVQHFMHASGRYELTARGRLNSAPLFAELATGLASSRGRSGVVVPTGVATDSFTQAFFAELVSARRLVSVFDFENRRGLFPGVDSRYRFSILVTAAPGQGPLEPMFAFYMLDPDDLQDPDRLFPLSASDLRLINPNTLTCPVFRSARDAELARRTYARVPVLNADKPASDGRPTWNYRGLLMFMTNTASHLFRSRHELERTGGTRRGNVITSPSERFLPLYEGKMVWQYDHRYGDFRTRSHDSGDSQLPLVAEADHAKSDFVPLPRHWITESDVEARLSGRWDRNWFLGFRDITNASNERTVIAAVVPRVAVANNLPLILTGRSPVEMLGLLANLNSLACDYFARQKVAGMHLNFYLLEQLPVLDPARYHAGCPWAPGSTLGEWIRPRAVELSYASVDLGSFARDVGWTGPPFAWDLDRRESIRAELDAAFFHLYSLARDEVEYVLETFPIVRRAEEQRHGHYRMRDLILAVYDAMAVATRDRPFVSRLDPAPGDPRAAHEPRLGEDPGYWVPWSEVLAQAPQAAPAARSVRTPVAPPAKSSPASLPRSTPEPTPSLFAMAPRPAWQPEAAVAPSEVVMGARVRHRAKGEGTVLSVRPSGKSTELLIRFDATGEAWIVFGYGVLEFEAHVGE